MDRGKVVEKSDCGQISSFFVAGSEQILSRVDRPGNSNLSILFEDVKDNFRNNQIFITIKNDEMEWKEVGAEGKYEKKNPSAFTAESVPQTSDDGFKFWGLEDIRLWGN